jgi:hydrogenase-4 component E
VNTPWLDTLMVLIVLTNLRFLGSSRLGACIRTVAVQGILLGFLPILAHSDDLTLRVFVLAVAGIGVKGLAFPWLLFRALRGAHVRREVEPYIGYSVSLAVGVGALGASLWIGSRLPLPERAVSPLLVPVALSMIFVGLLTMVSRQKALSQVLGYLIFENGIFAFGVGIAYQAPFLVELGSLLDVFVAVFVMGIAIFHIRREFDSIDTRRLDQLRD